MYVYLQHGFISPRVGKQYCRQNNMCYDVAQGGQIPAPICLSHRGKANVFCLCLLSSEMETWKVTKIRDYRIGGNLVHLRNMV